MLGGCWCCCVRGGNRLLVLGHVVETGAGAGAGCWVPVLALVSWLCTWRRQVAGAGAGCRCWCCELAVHKVEADWVLVPGAGAGCARSGDTPRCIACKNWSCWVQPRKIFCMLLLSGVYAGVILRFLLFNLFHSFLLVMKTPLLKTIGIRGPSVSHRATTSRKAARIACNPPAPTKHASSSSTPRWRRTTRKRGSRVRR